MTESATITVQNDIDLVLNGYTLRFTTPDAYLQFGTNTRCFIHGAGGAVVKELETTASADAKLVSAEGSSLRIKGGTYKIDGSIGGIALTFQATAACDLLELEDCTIEAKNTSATAIGIQTQAKNAFMYNIKSTADAYSFAYGMMTAGNVRITNTDVTASSDISESNALRVMSGNVSAEGSSFGADSDANYARSIYIANGSAIFNHCHIKADAYSYFAVGIELVGGSSKLQSSSITATAQKGENVCAWGIAVAKNTVLEVKESTVLADSTPNNVDPSGNTVGISNSGVAYLYDTKVYGSNVGVSNHKDAKLYVRGGIYTGYCHGGIYFAHGVDGEAFVNDAILRGGRYEGIYDFSGVTADTRYSALYIGGGGEISDSNQTAYMDGCFFDASECHRAIVVRGSSGEQNNTLNISNCFVTNGTLDEGTIRIDNETLKLNIGRGCNVTTDMFKNGYIRLNSDGTTRQETGDYLADGVAEYTNALYRKFPV